MQILVIPLLAAILALALPGLQATAQPRPDDRDRIHAVLDDFHHAAAQADRERYLGHFAPNGVFMGTDDWERWPLAEFRAYVSGRFAGGTGWRYLPEQRVVDFAEDGNTAWFDEVVVSPRWGRFRGTGVLLRLDSDWKIAHYSLTTLVPNERFEEMAEIAGEGFAARTTPTPP